MKSMIEKKSGNSSRECVRLQIGNPVIDVYHITSMHVQMVRHKGKKGGGGEPV